MLEEVRVKGLKDDREQVTDQGQGRPWIVPVKFSSKALNEHSKRVQEGEMIEEPFDTAGVPGTSKYFFRKTLLSEGLVEDESNGV